MRKISRQPLSANADNLLKRRTKIIEKADDKVKKCLSLWKLRSNNAFYEIRENLASSCRGRKRCMYCEDSEATDIEHFYPKSMHPSHAFSWDNYLLACSNCNSNYKRSQFPVDAVGHPLLINPMEDDPMDHLDLSFSTGKLVPCTKKGEVSIKVFGLDRQVLETGRRDAWAILCALVLRYDTLSRLAEKDEVERIVNALKNQSFSCVSLYAKSYYDLGHFDVVAPSDVHDAICRNPEVLEMALSQ